MAQNDQIPQNVGTTSSQPIQLHLPDFTAPDFAQPELERADLAQPGFVAPNPAQAIPLPLWPEDLPRAADERPDPALPDLLEPDEPDTLSYPAANAHMMPEPEYAPEVVMQQRPGELDAAALSIALDSPDDAELPAGLNYPQLYTSDDEMSRRKRHFALLERGLEQEARGEQ